MILFSAAVITAAFVDEREPAAVARSRPLLAPPYENKARALLSRPTLGGNTVFSGNQFKSHFFSRFTFHGIV